MVVTVFGLGFVGLTTAVGFAEKGIQVYGVDVNAERLGRIKKGQLPFYEPGLDEALVRNLNKNFHPTDDVSAAVRKSDCIYYCVGTPYGAGGEADLTYLYAAIDQTLEAMADEKASFKVLVTKSTVPPSTTQEKVIPYIEEKGIAIGEALGVANNPEFLREGYCWDDFMNADRIVLGVTDDRSKVILKQLYHPFEVPVFTVSLNTGEFIKYLSNTLLATLISYSNEMAVVADTIGSIDVAEAFKILHLDKRWGNATMSSYAYPGCGYGGYCLPKDTNALYALTKTKGFEAKILENVIATNDHMPTVIAERITKGLPKDAIIGILGLAFKPESDDVRDTPAAKIIKALLAKGYPNIIAYDPMATDAFKAYYHLPIAYAESTDDLEEKSDVLVIATAWEAFRAFKQSAKPVVDCRYML